MGTRSFIIAKISTGETKAIYCHWDGYPDNNGRLLLEHYQGQKTIDALMALGDLSSLREKIGRKHPFDGYDGNACSAYGRDRGEKGTEAREVTSLADTVADSANSGAEFVYVWDGQSWNITTPERGLPVIPLRYFMQGGISLDQTVKAFGGGFVIGVTDARAST